MLCKICERAIQAAAKRFSRFQHLDWDDQISLADLAEIPSHISLRSFYDSIREGCVLCRQLWAQILWRSSDSLPRPPKTPSSWTPFLDDLDYPAPTHLDEFYCQLSGPTNGTARWSSHTLAPIVKRGVFTTVWAAHRLFLRCSSLIRNKTLSGFVETAHHGLIKRAAIGIQFHSEWEFCARYIARSALTLYDLQPVDPGSKDAVITASGLGSRVSSSSMSSSTALWCHWYESCVSTHLICDAARQDLDPFVPKRLIEVLPADHGDIKKWKLNCNIANEDISYLTLSHCWGSSQPIRLQKDNVATLCNPAEISMLPKTYQHALMVTQSLGFQYIWIDSLCIVQDDEEDWEAQSSLMGSIYSHAACNIAATWASDGSVGCFSHGDLAAKSPTFVTLEGSLGGSYQLWQGGSYKVDIIDGPLNKRGWVVQERYLARQQLSFARRQIYWECQELMASEQFPTGLPESALEHQARLVYDNEDEARKAWNHMVELYSACQLTKKSDKLVAISGLARELQKIIHDDYICGLWRKDLHLQLLWRPVNDEYDQVTTHGQIAPTWSWANIDGPVLFDDHDSYRPTETLPLMEVLGAPVDPRNRLTLRGIAVRSHVMIPMERSSWNSGVTIVLADRLETLVSYTLNYMIMFIDLDSHKLPADLGSLHDQGEHGLDLLFFMVQTNDEWYRGLVLRPLLPSADGCLDYVRMGVFNVDSESMKPFREHLAARLGLSETGASIVGPHLDFDDPRLADLVHTVHIV